MGNQICRIKMPPNERKIFTNRTLNMRSIQAIGYDMDYTLIQYDVKRGERTMFDYLMNAWGSIMFNKRRIYWLFIFFCLMITTKVFAESSCIVCHTDEKMLTKNLAEKKEQKSAMQAGSG